MKNSLSSVILSAALLTVALSFGLWAVAKKKTQALVNLSVDGNIADRLVPRALSETEGQFSGLSEAANEVNSAKIEDFRSWSNQILADLPSKQEVQADASFTGEGAPKALEQAAVDISQLYSYVLENPKVRHQAVETFKDCANNAEGLDAIRAYCYAKAVRLNLELGGDFWDPSSVPLSIKSLSREL